MADKLTRLAPDDKQEVTRKCLHVLPWLKVFGWFFTIDDRKIFAIGFKMVNI